jgi:hypothetical protein
MKFIAAIVFCLCLWALAIFGGFRLAQETEIVDKVKAIDMTSVKDTLAMTAVPIDKGRKLLGEGLEYSGERIKDLGVYMQKP